MSKAALELGIRALRERTAVLERQPLPEPDGQGGAN
jgi:hypothetical protein